MTNIATTEFSSATTSQQLCLSLLKELNWSWATPKVVGWLSRVQQHYNGFIWVQGEEPPGFVFVSLAKFLDYYIKCNKLLTTFGWSWEHEKVLEVERLFGCCKQLPLEGYKYLLEVLEDERLITW